MEKTDQAHNWRDRYPDGASFSSAKNRNLLLIGMSGIGKTFLARHLSRDNWYHYSVDYRIGTRYLNEAILDDIKLRMMQDKLLAKLLRHDAIFPGLNLSFSNLMPLSQFVGMVGNPQTGGMELPNFLERQRLYKAAEIKSMQDITEFMHRANRIYHYPHFVADTTGSFCELLDFPLADNNDQIQEILALIANNFVLVYLKSDASSDQQLIARQLSDPKPMCYNEEFLQQQLTSYLQQHQLVDSNAIEPEQFLQQVFSKCLTFRKQRYQQLANRFGVTVSVSELYQALDSEQPADQIIKLIAEAIDAKVNSD